MNKLYGMPRPNVINLIDARDRKEYMRSEFNKLGVTDVFFHRFERIENSKVRFVGETPILKEMTPGVTSSHLLAIKWWYENTDEKFGIFFEDDVDFNTVKHWNFTFDEFIKRMGDKWDALQLCNIHEEYPVMVPRMRTWGDHGLQCYMVTRKYARKIIKYYFDQGDAWTIHYRMPAGIPLSTENNVLCLGRSFTFPLFNHNVGDFVSHNIYSTNSQDQACIDSYINIKEWWETKGSTFTLDDIFNFERANGQWYQPMTF